MLQVRAFRLACLAALIPVCAISCIAQSHLVAVTFDDLLAADTSDPDEVQSINLAILDSLDRYHIQATGFVNESKVQAIGQAQGKKILEQWVRRGHDLGNHTFSHADLNNLTVEEFQREVVSGEASFRIALAEVGRKPVYLRFPYNHTGNTKAKHDAVAAYLRQHGYQVATCTIDTSDYLFNDAYRKMLERRDESSVARLRSEYLAYTSAEIDYYTNLHKQVFGREIAHVMLLHANRLNADLMDELLAIFEDKQYQFVTLDVAQSDPVYKTQDSFVSAFGPMWGYRWAKERNIKVDGKLEAEPPEWVLQYGKARAE